MLNFFTVFTTLNYFLKSFHIGAYEWFQIFLYQFSKTYCLFSSARKVPRTKVKCKALTWYCIFQKWSSCAKCRKERQKPPQSEFTNWKINCFWAALMEKQSLKMENSLCSFIAFSLQDEQEPTGQIAILKRFHLLYVYSSTKKIQIPSFGRIYITSYYP